MGGRCDRCEAQLARQSGRGAEAVSELWPLITRLAAGHAEPEVPS